MGSLEQEGLRWSPAGLPAASGPPGGPAQACSTGSLIIQPSSLEGLTPDRRD